MFGAGEAHVHQKDWPSFVLIMAWHLFSAKPLPEPLLIYNELIYQENIAVTFYSKSTISIQEYALVVIR